MKRRQESTYPEPYIVLPKELICHIASFVCRSDIKTYLALLSVEQSAVHYLRDHIGEFFAEILVFLSGWEYAEKQKPLPAAILSMRDDSFGTTKSIVCWVHSVAVRGHVTVPEIHDSPVDTKMLSKVMHDKIIRYIRFCLLDKRYQTATHWSALLSFISLCRLHEAVFFKRTGEQVLESRDISSFVATSTQIGSIMHMDETTQRVIPLTQWPGIKTITVVVSKPGTLKARAFTKADKKYEKRQTKLQLIRFGLQSGTTYLQYSLTYKLLKEELKLRAVQPTDPVKAIVILPKNKKRVGAHHLCAKEHGDLLSHCFTYDGTVEEALIARRLRRDTRIHCALVENRFSVDEKDLIKPTEPDRITKLATKFITRKPDVTAV